ncbi:UNVERIFIED_ORG: hypothetical protein M2348_000635 [Sphingomonas sp. R1F5B]
METSDWLSPAKAFTLVADAYKAIQSQHTETASEWARDAVISALAKGHCKARAVEASLDLGGVHATFVFLWTKSLAPFSPLDANMRVSAALWQNFLLCNQRENQDWESGNLEFSGVEPITQQPIRGRAVGVELERKGLPLVGSESAYAVPTPPEAPVAIVKSEREQKPRLKPAELQRWWARLSVDEQNETQTALWEKCCAAHPNHAIARDRIRDLTRGRKPGRRPIRR